MLLLPLLLLCMPTLLLIRIRMLMVMLLLLLLTRMLMVMVKRLRLRPSNRCTCLCNPRPHRLTRRLRFPAIRQRWHCQRWVSLASQRQLVNQSQMPPLYQHQHHHRHPQRTRTICMPAAAARTTLRTAPPRRQCRFPFRLRCIRGRGLPIADQSISHWPQWQRPPPPKHHRHHHRQRRHL